MKIERLREKIIDLEYAEDIWYFYFSTEKKNYEIYISNVKDDYEKAAEHLCLHNTPISCYKVTASEPEIIKLKNEKEIALKNGIFPFEDMPIIEDQIELPIIEETNENELIPIENNEEENKLQIELDEILKIGNNEDDEWNFD